MKIALTVNGEPVEREVEPRTNLADFVREQLDLTGTHVGCEHGVCGACTVVINGETARSCITYAAACEGADVRTIEGYGDDALMTRLRQAFKAEHALQCGYCTPGMLMAARDLIRRRGGLDEAAIRREMSGNLCRCTGYVGIVRAISRVMAERSALIGPGEPAASHLGSLPPALARFGARVDGQGAAGAVPRNYAGAGGTVAVAGGLAATSVAALPEFEEAGATRFDESVTIKAPRDKVSALLGDIARTAACLPGARLDGSPQGDRFQGTMHVKLGPMAIAFAGFGRMQQASDGRSGCIEGAGRDGASRAQGRIRYALIESAGDATLVDFSIAYRLTGPLAQFGRGELVRDLVRQIARHFARNIEARLQADESGGAQSGGFGSRRPKATPASAELKAGALLLSVIWVRIKRLFGLSR